MTRPHPPRSFLRLMMGRAGIWAVFLTLFATPFALIWRAAETPLDGRVPGIIAAAAGGIAMLLWLAAIRRAARFRRLRRTGIATPARVTGHTKVGNKRAGGAPIYRADWRTEGGLSGHTPPLRSERLPKVGATINILVDPSGRDGVWDAQV